MDTMGPFPIPSLGGARYLLTFLDDYSGLSVVRPIKAKSQISGVVQEVLNLLATQTGFQVKNIRTDLGTEFVNSNLQGYLAKRGINHQKSAAYTPEQNGRAERLNRSIIEKTRSLLIDSGLPKVLWAEAACTANYLRNRQINSLNDSKTPFELAFGTVPDVSNLRIFGSKAYVKTPTSFVDKLDPRCKQGVLVGYTSMSKYRIFIPEENKVIITTDLIIDENHIVFKEKSTSMDKELENELEFNTIISYGNEEPATTPTSENDAAPVTEHDANQVIEEIPSDVTVSSDNQSQERRYPLRNRRPPSDWYVSTALSSEEIQTPETVEEALSSSCAEQWKEAMQEEISSLEANETWKLVSHPNDTKVLPCKWIFKLKLTKEGRIDRFKARLVAKGFKQEHGVDFNEVYSPVSKFSTLRTLLAIAATLDWEIIQLDIKTAFLNGRLDEVIYMYPPEGYSVADNTVCKLQKSLYGLRQAPRMWYTALCELLHKMDFAPSVEYLYF